MKLSKKVFVLVIVISIIAGGSASAMIDVIRSKIEDRSATVSDKIDQNFEEYQMEKRHMLLTTLDPQGGTVDQYLDEMEKEIMDYYWQHQYGDLNNNMNRESEEIKQLINQKKEELKQKIRDLFPDVTIPEDGEAKG